MKSRFILEHEPILFLFHNQNKPGELFEPVSTRVLSLEDAWRDELRERVWPTNKIPEILESDKEALLLLLREYLFASFAKSIAESMACENLIRFLSMQKGEKNIDVLQSSRITLIILSKMALLDFFA